MDDGELIAAVADGDDTALRELFGRHAPWLAARLRSVLSAVDTEDVLQETFLAVWRGAGGYRPVGPVGGWIWGIARRQAALFLRRRGPAELALPELTLPGAAASDSRRAGDAARAGERRTRRTRHCPGWSLRTRWRRSGPWIPRTAGSGS